MTDAAPEPRLPRMVGSMPVIDVSAWLAGEPGALERIAGELRYACEQVGFYFLTGHGIPPEAIDRVLAAAKRFHDQPLDEKLKLKVNQETVGYLPMKGSTTRTSKVNVNTKPNLNEAFFLKRESDEEAERLGRPPGNRNQWPENLPGFREDTLAYMHAMEALGQTLVPLYARALGMPADHFDAAFAKPGMTLRLSHYPHTEVLEDNEFGLAPHTDGNFATFLPPNPVSGLSIRLKDGTWCDVPYMAGAFVVNTGDILAHWSNDVFVSTPHRAINRSGEERYAIPFFLNANPKTLLECLPSCQGPDRPAKYEPITVEAYSEWFQRTNYPHLQKGKAA
ncbi:MAG: isopenicillin N synthase family oxygenase [Acetobacteraceae bacterium]|nr:MAG: isopenicillin N synthase family oxygenase [Acetobacteraceae bacterium]